MKNTSARLQEKYGNTDKHTLLIIGYRILLHHKVILILLGEISFVFVTYYQESSLLIRKSIKIYEIFKILKCCFITDLPYNPK